MSESISAPRLTDQSTAESEATDSPKGNRDRISRTLTRAVRSPLLDLCLGKWATGQLQPAGWTVASGEAETLQIADDHGCSHFNRRRQFKRATPRRRC